MTLEKTFQGAIRVSAMVGDYMETRQFFFYTEEEAIGEFCEEFGLPYPDESDIIRS